MAHYIAMAGFVGCLPDWTSGACDTRDEAIECAMHFADPEPGDPTIGRALKLDGIVATNESGTSYIEIVDCDCKDPSIHSEGK